jgi:hypothetical protein
VEETGVPGENHRPVASHSLTLLRNVVSSTPHHERDSNSVVIDAAFIDCCKPNYHTIMTTTAPRLANLFQMTEL